MKNQFLKNLLVVAAFAATLALALPVHGQEAPNSDMSAAEQSLRLAIERKTQELEAINKQIMENQGNLLEAEARGKTLKQELSRLDGNLSKLNLSIRSSEITIDKLNLEISLLQQDISDKERSVELKRQTVAQLIQDFQERDGESTLLIFLKNKSLAESVAEAQTITDLNNGLLAEVDEIKQLKDELSDRLGRVATSKRSVEQENQNLKYRKSIAEDQKSDRQALLNQTKNQEKAYQQVLSDLEKKQLEISDEISKNEEELRKNFDATLLPIKRPGVLGYPVDAKYIPRETQHYGKTKDSCRLYPKTCFHNGIDFGVPIGTPIYASEDGVVFASNNNGRIQYGRHIVIKHENNFATLYAHLSRQLVSAGQSVKRGDLIGYSGNTGYAFGAHLHFGVYWSPSLLLKSYPGAGLVPVGITIDPDEYL